MNGSSRHGGSWGQIDTLWIVLLFLVSLVFQPLVSAVVLGAFRTLENRLFKGLGLVFLVLGLHLRLLLGLRSAEVGLGRAWLPWQELIAKWNTSHGMHACLP